jgi:hypothetical protein
LTRAKFVSRKGTNVTQHAGTDLKLDTGLGKPRESVVNWPGRFSNAVPTELHPQPAISIPTSHHAGIPALLKQFGG